MTAAARESRSRRSFFFIGKSLCGLGKTAFEEAGGGSPDRPRMNARGIADGRLIYPAAIPELDRDFDHLVRSRSRSHRPPETGFHLGDVFLGGIGNDEFDVFDRDFVTDDFSQAQREVGTNKLGTLFYSS